MTHGSLLLRLLLASALVAVACGDLRSAVDEPGAPEDPGAGFGDGGPRGEGDAGTTRDGAPSDPVDAASSEADGGSTGLDPGVSIPALGQEACSSPGAANECPSLHVCRIATPDAGRCDDCSVKGTCAGLVTSPCATNRDCDLFLQCFRGVCTLFCSLPDGPQCGGESGSCVDVGHRTTGLCDPAKL